MNFGPIIALITVVVILVVSCFTVYAFRWITHKLGTGNLVKDGIILTEEGFEVPGFIFLHKKLISYSEVKSVELLSNFKSILFLFNFSVQWICPRLCGDMVAIELVSPPQFYKYLVVAPKNPSEFVEQIQRRIVEGKQSPRKSDR